MNSGREKHTGDFASRFRDVEEIVTHERRSTFRAVDPETEQAVFIKVLGQAASGDIEALQTFYRELSLLQGLSARDPSPVLPVLEIGQWDGRPCFVQPLEPGWSLARAMRKRCRFDPVSALELLDKSLEALELIHTAGFVHGDISPENILIVTDKEPLDSGRLPDEFNVQIVDFESARLVSATDMAPGKAMMGKAPYMAPELTDGKPMSPRSDLFALGVVFYEMLAGERPYKVKSAEDLSALSYEMTPQALAKLDAPDLINVILSETMSISPTHRGQTAASCRKSVRCALQMAYWLAETDVSIDSDSERESAETRSVILTPCRIVPDPDPGVPEDNAREEIKSLELLIIPDAPKTPKQPSGSTGADDDFRLEIISDGLNPDDDIVLDSVDPSEEFSDEFRREEISTQICVSLSIFDDEEPDVVDFSVFAPTSVAASSSFILEAWAYLTRQRDEAMRRAAQRVRAAPQHNEFLAERTRLTFVLQLNGFEAEDTRETIPWFGRITNTAFIVKCPADMNAGVYPGQIKVLHDGMLLTRLVFEIVVGQTTSEAESINLGVVRTESAFASYSSKDLARVLPRAQMLNTMGVDVFLDIVSLRSGQGWQEMLYEKIRETGTFYLFWSEAASRSQWVDLEWRYALEYRGLDYIHPVPLVSPKEAPPPKELEALHFNDIYLALMNSSRRS